MRVLKRSDLWLLVQIAAKGVGVHLYEEPERPPVIDPSHSVEVVYSDQPDGWKRKVKIPMCRPLEMSLGSIAAWDWPAEFFAGSTGGNRRALTAAWMIWTSPPIWVGEDGVVYPIEDD